MEQKNFGALKKELQLKAKNGIDFISAAGIVWFLIYIIWSLELTAFNKSVFTFMVGAVLLPLAFVFSKVFKTQWKLKENPLQPLGLWLNFAQLIYFPFLFFLLMEDPDHFVMGYAIITGAHLFPYAWLYDEMGYAVVAVLISLGSYLLALNVGVPQVAYIPLATSIVLLLFAVWMFLRIRRK